MNVIPIVLFLIILVALRYTYYYFNPTLLNNGEVIDLSQNPQFSIGLEEYDAKSIRYYYDGWLRIDNTPDQSKTYSIFNRGNDFIVALKGHRLSVYYASQRDDSGPKVSPRTGFLEDASAVIVVDIARNFPFQKWTYFCINVDANTMDVYLDGKLTKSISLPKPPSTPPIQLPGGTNSYDGTKSIEFTTFNKDLPISVGNTAVKGSLARFRRETGNMDPQSVWNAYILGPGVVSADESVTGDYHARVALTKNNKVKRSFNLF